jgi:hypothetical protein
MRDRPDQARLFQGLQAIVNRPQRNTWHPLFDPHKNLHRSWVIALFDQRIQNRPPLLRHPKPKPGDATGASGLRAFRGNFFRWLHGSWGMLGNIENDFKNNSY